MSTTDVNETTVAILREALDNAADRLIAKRESGVPKNQCPACGRIRKLTNGQVYFLIIAGLFFSTLLVGAIQR